jgi:hypothetical protein
MIIDNTHRQHISFHGPAESPLSASFRVRQPVQHRRPGSEYLLHRCDGLCKFGQARYARTRRDWEAGRRVDMARLTL